MMKILISTLPGVALVCALFLFALGLIQLRVYRKMGYKRSFDIALFSLFASVFALEQFIVQSRLLSPNFTHVFVMISAACYMLSLYFYIRALNYFLAIPRWVCLLYGRGTLALAGLTFGFVLAYVFFDIKTFFDPEHILGTGNYFVDSYSYRIGGPYIYGSAVLAASGFIVIVCSLVILRIVLKTSKDVYFIVGLSFSVLASVKENLLLPFTFDYFVPVIFVSNLFEAFRMNSLAYREYFKDLVSETVDKVPESEKYQNSNLSESRIQELADKITDVLDEDKLYLNANLVSEDLAKRIGIPPYQISQVINIGLNTTFFELISRYRIDEVKRRLSDSNYADETIINIAYNSGFNSKSAFNTAFKKQTGVTPSAFRKNQ